MTLYSQSFRDGKVRCLVATDVAARGLDIPEVDLVVQSEPPKVSKASCLCHFLLFLKFVCATQSLLTIKHCKTAIPKSNLKVKPQQTMDSFHQKVELLVNVRVLNIFLFIMSLR